SIIAVRVETELVSRRDLDCPCPIQRKSTSASLLRDALKTISVRPSKSWCTSYSFFPALLLLAASTNSTSGCPNKMRINSPPVYPAAPATAALIFFMIRVLFFVNPVIHAILIPRNTDKTFHILASPGFIFFSVCAKGRSHQVVFGANTCHLKAEGIKFHPNLSAYFFLAITKKCLQVSHHGVQVKALVQVVSVKSTDLLLPL